jgi:hypothetical protein
VTTSPSLDTYKRITHEAEVDGGWSGQLRVLVASSNSDEQLVFVDSDLLGPRRLMLTANEAVALSEALSSAADELIPPHSYDFESFYSVFRQPAPAEHTRTRADLKRHVKALSDQRAAERKRA